MKNILIVGLGAVGTVFAVFLKKAGHKVYGLVRDKSKYKCETLKVDGIWGVHEAKLDAVVDKVEDLNTNFDLIIVAVKSFDTEEVVKSIKDLAKEKTFVLLTQNGYGNYETAINHIKKEKVLLGRVIFGSKINQPCYATVTVNADDIRIGHPENLANKKLVSISVSSFYIHNKPASCLLFF